jgi:hypothetical protein
MPWSSFRRFACPIEKELLSGADWIIHICDNIFGNGKPGKVAAGSKIF